MPKPPFFAPLALALSLSLAACSGDKEDGKNSQPGGFFETPLLAQGPSIRNVSVAEARALIDTDSAITILDVRTPAEFEQGHIRGAVNLDAMSDDFAERVAQLKKDDAYLIHCRSGRRSAAALETMRAAGFSAVAHMNEGVNGWTQAGLPLEP